MKKIPTLFKRDPDNRARVLPEHAVELPPGAVATAKWDGTAVRFDGVRWWARREVKPGKPTPPDFDEVDHDPVTDKRVGWVPITDDPQWKWHLEAISDLGSCGSVPGTYEAVGPHFQGNPHGFDWDLLIQHGTHQLYPPQSYEGLRVWLAASDMEGVVWWVDGEPVAKIKRRDFGLPWPVEERA